MAPAPPQPAPAGRIVGRGPVLDGAGSSSAPLAGRIVLTGVGRRGVVKRDSRRWWTPAPSRADIRSTRLPTLDHGDSGLPRRRRSTHRIGTSSSTMQPDSICGTTQARRQPRTSEISQPRGELRRRGKGATPRLDDRPGSTQLAEGRETRSTAQGEADVEFQGAACDIRGVGSWANVSSG